MCEKAGNKKRNSPCGKPARKKAFELHTVSEIILKVVMNTIWPAQQVEWVIFLMHIEAPHCSQFNQQ